MPPEILAEWANDSEDFEVSQDKKLERMEEEANSDYGEIETDF